MIAISKYRRTDTLAIVLTCAGLLVACTKHEPPTETIRPVLVQRVKFGAAAEVASYSGEIRARHEADLGFRIGGKMVARYVDVGAEVKKGAILARLDPEDVRLSESAAQAQVRAATTDLGFAKSEFSRFENLVREKFVSASALDAKRSAYQSAQARLEQARAQLGVNRNQFQYAVLAADQDGVITSVSAEPGQVLSAGQPVARLARPDEKDAVINVSENRLAELQQAKDITVNLWANAGKTYHGKLRETAPGADPTTRTYAAKIAILNPDPEVKLGMTVSVSLVAESPANLALLPLTALYQKDGKPALWIVDPKSNKVGLRAVEVGQYREDGVTVVKGVVSDELVVVAGVHKLVEGQLVRLPDGQTQPGSQKDARASQS
jgi:RND family efflux transporter MFP subunit